MNIMNYVTRDVLTVRPDDSIDRAISLMEEKEVHHLVVMDGQQVVGMVSDRDVLISTGWMLSVERAVRTPGGPQVVGPTRVDQIMARPVVTLSPTASARDAALLMEHHRIGAVPVLQNGKLAGILTETDLLRWLDQLRLVDRRVETFLARPVDELMRPFVISVRPQTPLEDVVSIFRSNRVRHVPVASDHQLVGIISDRDVRRALGWSSVRDMQAEATGHLPSAEPPNRAADIMHTDVSTVAPYNLLHEALRKMLDRHVHSLPVVDGQRLTGILTQTDFVKAVAREELL